MTTAYQAEGHVIQWTNNTAAAVTSDQVVKINKILGIALVNIAVGETGSVGIRGVYTAPKVSGAVIAQGESLTWDVSAGAFDDQLATPATGDVTGAPAVAFEAAGNGTTSLAVYFTGVPGTVA